MTEEHFKAVDKPDSLDKELSSIFYQYDAEKNQGLNELAGHGTAVEQAVAQLKAIIQRERADELISIYDRNPPIMTRKDDGSLVVDRIAHLNGGKNNG